ncbi:hypothetical protein C1646_772651 [Rhizophagus diaphanus]|nr:hypothetical protein C1646_772651 [Rhizophagus diaphanus] [Rhizophagus sp. MUCL 43196]
MMRSLDDVIWSGKVLYVAASNIPSWALACDNTNANLRGWRLTPEQMIRLDAVSRLPEIPFPHSVNNRIDDFIGKNVEMPKIYQSIKNINRDY